MTIIAEVEIDFPDGTRTIEMLKKDRHEIENCKEGKVVMLCMKNGQVYTGKFKNSDEDDIIIESISSNYSIGLPDTGLGYYFEEIEKENLNKNEYDTQIDDETMD